MHFPEVFWSRSLVLIVTQMPQQTINFWSFCVASSQRIVPTCWYCLWCNASKTHKSNDPYLNENGRTESATSHIYIYIWHSNTTSTREKIFSTLSFHPPSLLMKLTKYPQKSTSLSSNTSVWKCATRPYPFQATQMNISFTSILMPPKNMCEESGGEQHSIKLLG